MTHPQGGAGAAGRLPEVRPEDASPRVRALYQDIARATGIPQVNLIFRHLALEPDVLEWCWGAVAPAYRDGRLSTAAARLQAGITVPRHPPVWEAVGGDEAAGVRAVLSFYNRGNSTNLIGLRTLLRLAEGAGRGSGGVATVRAPAEPAPARPSTAEVPPLPRPEAVPPEAMALVADLSERQGTAAFGVQPSMWLHLTLWPAAMRRGHETVRPLLDAPEWPAMVNRLVADADALAGELAAGLETPAASRPEDEVLHGYLRTVRQFVDLPIPQMVLIGRMLAGGAP